MTSRQNMLWRRQIVLVEKSSQLRSQLERFSLETDSCLQRSVCLYSHLKTIDRLAAASMWPVLQFLIGSACVCFFTPICASRGSSVTGAINGLWHRLVFAMLRSCILYNVHMSVYNFPSLSDVCFSFVHIWETVVAFISEMSAYGHLFFFTPFSLTIVFAFHDLFHPFICLITCCNALNIMGKITSSETSPLSATWSMFLKVKDGQSLRSMCGCTEQ